MSLPTEASFLSDVADHRMHVLLDQGIHRHLRFQQPHSSVYWFDVVTFPGGLCYTGETITIERGHDPARVDWLDRTWRFPAYRHSAERTLLLSALMRLQLHHGRNAMHEIVHESYLSKKTRRIEQVLS